VNSKGQVYKAGNQALTTRGGRHETIRCILPPRPGAIIAPPAGADDPRGRAAVATLQRDFAAGITTMNLS
jgi:hypothetical protein